MNSPLRQPGSDDAPAAVGAPGDPNCGPTGFEGCVREIEDIIERIDAGEIGLEKSLAEYERGVGLIRRCREVLKRVEQRVEELTERALGG